MPDPNFEFSDKDYLMQPKGQPIYPIKESDLRRIEKMIQNIPQKGFSYQNLGYAGVGGILGGIGMLVSLKYAQGVSTFMWVCGWLLFFGSFIVSCLSFRFSTDESNNISTTTQSVMNEISLLKESVYNPRESKQVGSQPPRRLKEENHELSTTE